MTALRDEIGRLLDDVSDQIGPAADGTVMLLDAELREPLSIAVTGRTNAGKSTLVNALIGRRIAPTQSTECTRVVTWYRCGSHQSQIVYTDGGTEPLWLTTDGRLPDDLTQPAENIERLEVWIDYEPLDDVTIVDTPGLSGDENLADRTERLLTAGHAHVLLFVFGETIRDDERRVVSDFRKHTEWLYDFPANAYGIVSRADQLSGPDGPWTRAQSVAADHAATLPNDLAGALPVMGKLAQTTQTAALREDHAAWLRTIAALDADARARALRWPHAFAQSDVLTPEARATLMDRLDLYGIRLLTSPEHANSSCDEMYEALRSHSGFTALSDRLNVLFLRPAPVHKALHVLSRLDRFVRGITEPGETRDELLDRIQVIRDAPAMHTVAELRALVNIYSGRCDLGEPATQRALRLFERTDAAERLDYDGPRDADLAELALNATRYWKTLANTATDLISTSVAETASTSAFLLHNGLRSRS